MAVLVTGGSGVLGLHVARELARRGEEVVAYSMSGAPPYAELVLDEFASLVKFIKGDIREFEQLLDVAKRCGADGIIHTAALTGEAQATAKPLEVFAVNAGGTANVLEVARLLEMRRVVHIGSSAEYGQRLDLKPIREDELNVDGMYAESKYLAYRMAERYRQLFGLDVLTVRVSSVYGPNTRFNAFRGLVGNTLIAHLCRAVAMGEPVTVQGGGDYTRGWTYAADCAKGICQAFDARKSLRYQTYNVASGRLYSLTDVINAIVEIEPKAHIRIDSESGAGDSFGARTIRGPLDISRAREDLGFTPQCELGEGMREYIAWWRQLGKDGMEIFSRPRT